MLRLSDFLEQEVQKTLDSWKAKPELIEEQANQEDEIQSGGYAHRQLYELIQNGADQIKRSGTSGSVEVILTDTTLYCANQGQPIDEDGVRALLQSHLSRKNSNEIGRFGLGFKSVLRVCDHPEFLSNAISFRFNPPEFDPTLKQLSGNRYQAFPKLRTACVLDNEVEIRTDSVLADLLVHYSTVIRLRLKPDSGHHLAQDIVNFPAEFLLFSPHVRRLTLTFPDGSRREIGVEQLDTPGCVLLREGDSAVEWRMFFTSVDVDSLSEECRADMDSRLRQRQSFPLSWAVPVDSPSTQRGRLWAFFPTQTETSLAGILNGPWKTNSDRENLLDGEFNRELLRRASNLVCDNILTLNTPDDPVRFLDAIPARDSSGWADEHIRGVVLNRLRSEKCLATGDGRRDVPSAIGIVPRLPAADLLEWMFERECPAPPSTVHPSTYKRERLGRARSLGCPTLPPGEVVKRVASAGSPSASIAAILLANRLASHCTEHDQRMLQAQSFVLTESMQLTAPNPQTLGFANADSDDTLEHELVVHREVAAHVEASRVLRDRFKISPVSYETAFRKLLAETWHERLDWKRFWTLARHVEPSVAFQLLREWDRPICAKTTGGEFRSLGSVLLPGIVVAAGSTADYMSPVVDITFHSTDRGLLEKLGASDRPRLVDTNTVRLLGYRGQIVDRHRNEAITQFRTHCTDSQPQESYLAFDAPAVSPIEPLAYLFSTEAVRFTAQLLSLARSNAVWRMIHTSGTKRYPTVSVPSLPVWAIRHNGWLDTSLGPRKIQEAVSRHFDKWEKFLPVAKYRPEDEALLDLPKTADQIPEAVWSFALDCSFPVSRDQLTWGEFLAFACQCNVLCPKTLACHTHETVNTFPPDEITVVTDLGVVPRLRSQGTPFIYVRNGADSNALVSRWGLRTLPNAKVGFDAAGELELAVDRLPSLRTLGEAPVTLRLQECISLWEEVRDNVNGLVRHALEFSVQDDTFYYVGARESEWLMTHLLAHFGIEQGSPAWKSLTQQSRSEDISALRDSIGTAERIEDKLVQAIGVDALRAGIPERHLRLVSHFTGNTPDIVARLALAVHGTEVLKEYRDELAAKGLNPPAQWVGGSRAIEFVRDLGFPEEFAGYPTSTRPPFEDISGPAILNELHDYQRSMRDKAIKVLHSDPAERGLLSLPTGAGKTRIAVESIIDWIKSRNGESHCVLWIAQSDELCEQSVRCWMQAWRAFGPPNSPLRINRMWGTTNDRVAPSESGSTVVVATYQTLGNRLDSPEYGWVFAADAVVVDEAHGSVAATYTGILSRLGLDKKQTQRPLIGLTATPFRASQDIRDTMHLAFRYGHQRIDYIPDTGDGLYKFLQDRRVLALADHEELPGDEVEMTVEELAELERNQNWLPASVEKRLAADDMRNDRILEHIRSQHPTWPILVFAASVEHAEDLAVRLTMDGVPACSISGQTSTGRRRHAIEEFNRGKVRVLTNFGVLTTGFDAPSVRALYVTRPVFSPVLYQQMIGRGLRGPENGGKERCLIVNVADNIRQYGQQLAFQRFDNLWTRI